MELSPDEIAGVVDLFGALPPDGLRRSLAELAFKRGEDRTPADFDEVVDAAIESYHLLALGGEDPLLIVGPVAFPTLPEDAGDLPHIIDAERRNVDRDRLATTARRRFRADADSALDDGDSERIEALLDVSYELEAWAPVDIEATRDRLISALEGI